ncbi:MAG: hypothetical protein ABIF08_00715 [Nanoarchaeota archaeon]
MLSETEEQILAILKGKHLITKHELVTRLQRENGNSTQVNVERLIDMGYVDKVESLGTCLVITQKGIRLLENK